MKSKRTESVAEFKVRIAKIMRKRNGYGSYEIVGAAHADPCVVRGPKDRGFQKPTK